jgi:TfoX/Sxy family transcriptional regulator of competence genes
MPSPKMTPSSPELQARFKAVATGIPGAQPRKMFGYDSFFIDGKFAAGLWRNTVVFKLSDPDLAAFLKVPGARPFAPMQGRVMKNWGEAPESLAKSVVQLQAWCAKAAAYAAALPAKPPKPAKKKKT